MRTCRSKPVQASFSSCLGQLFLKTFNFFCVPLALLVWLLNAWLSSCLDVLGDHQGKQTSKKKPSMPHTFYICTYLFPNTVSIQAILAKVFPIQPELNCRCKPVQASFSSCLGQLFSKIFNFFCVPLPLLVWLLNAWLSACLDVLGDHKRKQTSKKKPSMSHTFYICTYLYPKTMSICHPCHATFPTQWGHAGPSQCKQASAAALDSCFWRPSTSSAFRCRSWSDSSMLDSVHVWTC